MHSAKPNNQLGMTLIELIVLVVIVGFLAAMLLPMGFPNRRSAALRASAQYEMCDIATAFRSYKSTYGRWPVSTNIERSGSADFTFGTHETKTTSLVTNGGAVEANNSEVVSIIMDERVFKDGRPSPNHDGSLNPRRMQFLNAKQVSDIQSSGVGPDGVYRDPWGNPYIITIDLDSNGGCCDAYYSRANVSALTGGTNGFCGLIRQTNSSGAEVYQSESSIMIWSFGPDGKADRNTKANQGVNKDNVLGWR